MRTDAPPPKWPSVVRDVAGCIGALLLVYGAARVNIPAGCIVAGLLLITGALLTARGA